MPSSRIKASWLPTRAAQSAAERWLPSTPISRRIAKVSRYSSTMQPISQQFLRKRNSWQSTEWIADNSHPLGQLLKTFLFSALRPTSSVWKWHKGKLDCDLLTLFGSYIPGNLHFTQVIPDFSKAHHRNWSGYCFPGQTSCNPSPLILAFYESRFSFFLPEQKKRSHAVFRSQIQTRKVIVSNP
jgi:hypothetical protein